MQQKSPSGTVKVQWRLDPNGKPMDDLSPATIQASPNVRRKKFKGNTVEVHGGQSELFNSMKGSLGARNPQLAKIIPSRRKR